MNYRIALSKPGNAYASFFVFLLFISVSIPCYAQSQSDMQNPAFLASEGWNVLIKRGDKDKIKKAEALFQKALSLDPNNAEALTGIGRIIFMNGHIIDDQYKKDACREAMKYYDKASSIDRNNDYVHYLKSDAYLCLEDYDNAIKEADLLRITPCSEHFLRARAYLGKIKSTPKASYKHLATIEAIDYLECVENRNIFSTMSNPLDLLRKTLRTTKEFKYATGHFKKNMQLKPHSMWSYHDYYWTILLKIREGYLDNSDVAEAEKAIKKAKTATNHDIGHMSEIYYARALRFNEKKQYNNALTEYIKSFEANPQNMHFKEMILKTCLQLSQEHCVKAWHKVIRAYVNTGDCARAEKEFNSKYKKHPPSFESLKTVVAKCKAKK